MNEKVTHLWATEPDETLRDRFEITILHNYGDLPESVQIKAFEAARAVVDRYGASGGSAS